MNSKVKYELEAMIKDVYKDLVKHGDQADILAFFSKELGRVETAPEAVNEEAINIEGEQ